MLELLGLAMFYSWIHALVILVKKDHIATQYETFVKWFALVTLVLFIIGSLSN